MLDFCQIFAFFLYGSDTHRDVHSFPTRRSSDLDRMGHFYNTINKETLDLQRGVVQNEKRQRSEEHTSELQSLRHLVCRLLLEKKKRTRDGQRARSYRAVDPTRPADRRVRARRPK